MSSFRNRSDTVDTAGTLTSVEKARLLEEMPSYHDDDEDGEEEAIWGEEGEDGKKMNPSAAGDHDHDKDESGKKPAARPADNNNAHDSDDSLWGDADQDDAELYGGTRAELQSRPTHRQFLKERGWKSHKQMAREAERKRQKEKQESQGSLAREDTASRPSSSKGA